MKILITGGGGFLGNAIIQRLLAQHHDIVTFARGDYPNLAALGVTTLRGDLSDTTAVIRAAQGCNLIIHTAAKAGVWGPYNDYYRANVLGTQNVIDACRAHRIPRLIYTSTPSVTFTGHDQIGIDESAPFAPVFLCHYPATKARAEQLVLDANGPDLATVALRPHLIWGPGDPHLVPRVIAQGRAGKLRIVGKGDSLVDSTYIDNAAHAHTCAIETLQPGAPCAGKPYFISNGEPIPMAELLNRILAAANLPPVTRHIPAGIAYAAGATMELTYRLLRKREEPRMTRFIAKQLATAHHFNLTAAHRDLNYTPIITTNQGMTQLAQHLQSGGDH